MDSQPFKVACVQAAPAFLDKEAGVEKTIQLIAEAAQAGAKLVAFPECWIPGYPWWIWLDSPAWGMQFVRRHFENCITADGDEVKRIAAAAKAHDVHLVMGYSERCAGSLYIAQLLIGPDGTLIQSRRKLKATHVERTVFGEGDGSDIRVHDTALGRLGGLCCWEHLNPLAKFAMYAQNEQIHVAAWPSFSLYTGAAHALGPVLNNAVSQVYAAEAQCFVIAPCGVVSPAMVELMCDTPVKRQLLQVGGGHAMIYGPDGAPLNEPLAPDVEGIVFATIDVGDIVLAKSAADPAGHYSRPDVLRLLFNPEPNPCVQRLGDRDLLSRDPKKPFRLEPGSGVEILGDRSIPEARMPATLLEQ